MSSRAPDARDPGVVLINPLPLTLAHYEKALRDVLTHFGRPASTLPSLTIELGEAARLRRLARGASVVAQRARPASRDGDRAIVLWPAFGLIDPVTWLMRRGRVGLIVHDPRALRRQFGLGDLAGRLGRWASQHGVDVVVHSTLAEEELRSRAWRIRRLPHPIEQPRPIGGGGESILVLGQWKPARSLEPLRVLAESPALDGRRVVVGRGWSAIDGWQVDARFVDEPEVNARIDQAACVVLPYDRYFQSGVAVRSLERLTPVVGRRHPFLGSLFGDDWEGFVEDEDWPGAVDRATSVSRARMLTLRQEYWEHCVESWRQFVDER
jgi:hypothetical protein